MIKIILSFVYIFGFIILSRWSFDGIFQEGNISILGLIWSLIFAFFVGFYIGIPFAFKKITESKHLRLSKLKTLCLLIGLAVSLLVISYISSLYLLNSVMIYTALIGYLLICLSGLSITLFLKPINEEKTQ
ncbi:hypothetical protein [Bacillus atrophaeus]|uniref:hypothetical protein n=1 Tax=Bacillus atrophaeus TaxID=1452 RepID=UPI002280D799|nr:hypothetical protein [Bacillus atrophaeus]MCY8518638.1 hypothetical protein [Bacillus atrophaeus]